MIYENLHLLGYFPAAVDSYLYSNSASMNFAPNLFPFYFVNPVFSQPSVPTPAVSPKNSEICMKDSIEKTKEKPPRADNSFVKRKTKRSFKSKRWTFDEDSQLIELIKTYSLDWYKISAEMKNRAPDALKNRFYGVLKKNLPSDLIKEVEYSIRTKRQIRKESDIRSFIDDKFQAEANTKIIESSIEELKEELLNSEAMPKMEKKILLEKLKGNMDKLEAHLSVVRSKILTLSTKSLN